jgi:hypothetical protein
LAIVTKRWDGMRWTLWRQACVSASDENAEAYGEVVWSWRRDAGAKSAENIPPATVAIKPLTGESAL